MERRTKIIIGAAAGLALVVIVAAVLFWFLGQPAPTITVKTGPLPERPGAAVTVDGAHFPPNAEIYVGLAAPAVPPTSGTSFVTAKTGRDGTFNVTFPFPADPHWTTLTEVTIYAGTPGGETVGTARLTLDSIAWLLTTTPSPSAPEPSATPTVSATPSPTSVPVPAISLQPASGGVGITVVVNGRGWRSNETLSLSLLGSNAQTVGTVRTDAQGNFETAFVFPVNWAGPSAAAVLAVSQDGSEQASAVFQVSDLASPTPTPTVPSPTPIIITGWLGQYFNNQALIGSPVLVRNDNDIYFDWGTGSPAPGLVPGDHFSVRWTRSLYLPAGVYRFFAQVDDAVRVWLDNNLLIDQWHDYTGNQYTRDYTVSEGMHTVRVEYFENMGLANVHVWWQLVPPTPTNTPTFTSTPTPTATATATATATTAVPVSPQP